MRSFLFALVLLGANSAVAQPTGPVSAVRLLGGWPEADGSHFAGVEIRLARGWKTYWRAPGDAGIPPQFDWSGSQNVADVDVFYPQPGFFPTAGMLTIGYADAVVMPVRVEPEDPSAPITLALDISYGVCADICIPAEASVTTLLPHQPSHTSTVIRDAMNRTPLSGQAGGVVDHVCRVQPAGDNDYLISAEVQFGGPLGGTPFTVFETGSELIWVGMADTEVNGATLTATAPMQSWSDGPLTLDRSDLRVTLLGRDRAIELLGCPAG